jgi:hypothetical protein
LAVVIVVFKLVFCGRLVVPCDGFFVATVIVGVFELLFVCRLGVLAVDSLL